MKVFLIVVISVILFFILSFLYMIKPRRRRDTSYFEGKLYAHRGLHDETVPENSLTAFRLAKEAGYGVELDVQMTKDKQLVVFHDGSLKRMTGVDAYLRDCTYEELSKLRLKDTDEIIPLFSDVCKILQKTDMICEIKGDNGLKNYELCEKTYDMLMTYEGKFMVESFSPFLVGWFRKNHPEIIRGQLSDNFKKNGEKGVLYLLLTHLIGNKESRPDFIAYNHYHTSAFGYQVCTRLFRPLKVAWTARGEEEIESAKKKFDIVIFEKNPPK